MTAFFLSVLERSIAASFVILAVIAARALTRRSPKWIRSVLWALVALRLILPFTLHSAVSLVPELPKFTHEEQTVSPAEPSHDVPPSIAAPPAAVHPPVTDDIKLEPSGSAVQGTEGQNTVPQTTLPPEMSAQDNAPGVTAADIASIVWTMGVVAMFLYFAIGYVRLWTRVRGATPTEAGTWQSDRIDSAFVFGVIRPHIFLPTGVDVVATECMIAHERAHIRRGDHITKLLAFFLLAMHWFNPVMWLAYVLFCRDIELACDEHVIRSIEPGRVQEYARTLLDAGTAPGSVEAFPLSFSRYSVKARIKNILNYKKPSVWVIGAALLVCVITAICFATAPIAKNENRDVPPPLETDHTDPVSDHTGEPLFSYADAPVRSVGISWEENTGRTVRLTADGDRAGELARFADALRYCAPADEDAALAGLTVTLTYEDEHTQTRPLGRATIDGTDYAVNIQEKTEFFTLLQKELAVYFKSDSAELGEAYTFLMYELDPADTLEWEQTLLLIRREGEPERKIDRTQCTVHTLEYGEAKYLLISHGSVFDLQRDSFSKEDDVIIRPEPKPKPEPEVNYTYTARDTALPGDSVGFDILSKTDVSTDFKNCFLVPIQGWNGFNNRCYFFIDVMRCADDISELYLNGFSLPIGPPFTHKTFELEQYDDDFFGDEYAMIVLFHRSAHHKDIQVESVKRSGGELCIEASIPQYDPDSGIIPNTGYYVFCTPLKVRNEDLKGIDTVSVFLQAAD